MPSLKLNGATPSSGKDIDRRLETLAQLNTGISRDYVSGRAVTLAVNKATKTYVDNQDANYQLVSYYQSQDTNTLIPLASKGVANGVASLDTTGKIPAAQVPSLGAGIVKGPYGPTSVQDVTTSTTPVMMCQWNIGVQAINFKPVVFISSSVKSTGFGRPVIEVRMGDATQTTYASQTLVAKAFGRSYYNDYQTLTILPSPDTLGAMSNGVQTFYPATMNIRLTAWLYDANGKTVTTSSGLIIAATAWLLRVVT